MPNCAICKKSVTTSIVLCGHCAKGAQVSEKHCGFVINRNQATAADVEELCHQNHQP